MQDCPVFLISGFPDFSAPGFNMDAYNQQFREKNTVISAKAKNVFYKKHWGGLSLKFAFNGNEYYTTGHSNYAVNDSNFLILNNNTEYSSFIDSDTEVDSFTLNFSESFIRDALNTHLARPEDILEHNFREDRNEIHFVEKTYGIHTGISSVALGIKKQLKDFDANSEEIAELFGELFLAMLALNSDVKNEIGNIRKLKTSTREELYRRLNYARDYMECCFDQGLSLSKVARVACLNKEYFIRQFKIYFGQTPAQFLIQKRMAAAEKIIITSDTAISEVCRRVGYSDLTSFGKLFRKYYKTNPENYRRIHANKLLS
jgi:AraC family transcriptional regulator